LPRDAIVSAQWRDGNDSLERQAARKPRERGSATGVVTSADESGLRNTPGHLWRAPLIPSTGSPVGRTTIRSVKRARKSRYQASLCCGGAATAARRSLPPRDASRRLALCDGPVADRRRRPDGAFRGCIERQATQTFINLVAIVEAAGYTLADAVFVRIYLADFDRDYDRFNQVYRRFFADDNASPSRRTVGVTRLGRGALVEIDLTLYRAPSR
jgi:hypothetical protein